MQHGYSGYGHRWASCCSTTAQEGCCFKNSPFLLEVGEAEQRAVSCFHDTMTEVPACFAGEGFQGTDWKLQLHGVGWEPAIHLDHPVLLCLISKTCI